MAFTLDNHTLLYIIIALFVVQLLVMRYYVNSSIDDANHKNTKKIIKKLSGQISVTFDQYMGNNKQNVQQEKEYVDRRRVENRRVESRQVINNIDDSIDDPAEDINDNYEQQDDATEE